MAKPTLKMTLKSKPTLRLTEKPVSHARLVPVDTVARRNAVIRKIA